MSATDGACHDLSILCVTKAEECIRALLTTLATDADKIGAECILAADGESALEALRWPFCPAVPHGLLLVHSRGYVESVLDEAIAATSRAYVLRIDDDESMSPAMLRWLGSGAYRSADNWSFPRQQYWQQWSAELGHPLIGCLMTPHLWPDRQTRLSVRAKAGGRHGVHQGSIHGEGEVAPVAIRHFKYVVRSREDRRRIAQTYDKYSPGYGTGNMKPFSLPEEAYETMRVVEAGDGSVPWTPKWETLVDNRDHGF